MVSTQSMRAVASSSTACRAGSFRTAAVKTTPVSALVIHFGGDLHAPCQVGPAALLDAEQDVGEDKADQQRIAIGGVEAARPVDEVVDENTAAGDQHTGEERQEKVACAHIGRQGRTAC